MERGTDMDEERLPVTISIIIAGDMPDFQYFLREG